MMLEVRDLVKVYGEGKKGYPALRGLSFSLAPGEFAAVMGPSGCGKSTLLNVLGLLDRPTSGNYLLEGREVGGLDDSERTRLRRARLGFVFQAFNLLPRLTAVENVAMPMTYAGVPKPERQARAQALLARVGLGSKGHHTPLELSGGERQRVGIARALGNQPAVLLADEPTGNLDSTTSAEILALFEELHREGRTILLVTHDRAIAGRAQRVLRIQDGKLANGDS